MIGGNTQAVLQQNTGSATNAIGEGVSEWKDVATLVGFLDLSSGDSKYSTYNAKLQESTHIFLCDYTTTIDRNPTNKRMVIGGLNYDVLLIDDPMELHQHLEIYLRYVG